MRSAWLRVLLLIGALPLGGCIVSDYDIGRKLPPAFPIADGAYKAASDDALVLRRAGSHYRIVDETHPGPLLSFFASPGEPGAFITQLSEMRDGRTTYLYAFARFGEGRDSLIVADLDKPDLALVPQPLRGLMKADFGTLTVVHGARDTLRLLREIARLGIDRNPQVRTVVYRPAPR